MVLVSPAVDIVRLELNLEWPVRLFLFVAVLIELGDLHDGSGTWVVSNGSQVLADSPASALVVRFTKDGDPPVFEEIPRCLAVEVEHSEDVS